MIEEAALYEQIDLYLQGKLPEAERLALEVELTNRPDLLAAHRAARELFLTQELMNLKKKMQTDLSSSPSSRWIWGLGGAMALLAGISIYVFVLNKKNTPNTSSVTITPSTPIEISTHKSSDETYAAETKAQSTTLSAQNVQKITPHTPATPKSETDSNSLLINIEPSAQAKGPQETIKNITNPIKGTNLCANREITAKLKSTSTCAGKEQGVIYVQNIKGGQPPYRFSIDQGKNFILPARFEDLPEGNYQIQVQDKDLCVAHFEAHIASRRCVESLEVILHPQQGPWKIPSTKAGNLKIINQNGILVCSKSWTEGSEEEWDGISQQGSLLPQGYYGLEITYQDGEIIQGHVNIMY